VKVIFLDIDGVLNHCDTRSDVSPTTKEPLPIPIAPECMARLNRLIAETGAKIVISSSWRLFARWQDLGPALARHGLVGDVIGETPDLVNDDVWLENWRTREGVPFAFEKLERGWEIREWLAAHPMVTAFVILDDVSDMDELKPWLVLTHPNDGLDDPDVERAKWLLNRPTNGLALARDRALGTGHPCAKCGHSGKTWDVPDWESGGFAWICVDEAACTARRTRFQAHGEERHA
jgi:HAD domain in Swiss Army Knife RNA repair proteins